MPAAGGSSFVELGTEREEHSLTSACQKKWATAWGYPIKSFWTAHGRCCQKGMFIEWQVGDTYTPIPRPVPEVKSHVLHCHFYLYRKTSRLYLGLKNHGNFKNLHYSLFLFHSPLRTFTACICTEIVMFLLLLSCVCSCLKKEAHNKLNLSYLTLFKKLH